MARRPTAHAGAAAARMADADRLVQIHLRIRAGSLADVDALAAREGLSRSAVLRDAVTWLLAREAAWLARAAYLERARRLDDEQRALAAQIRNPGGDL